MVAVKQNIMFHSFSRFWMKKRGETDQLDPCFCQLLKESFFAPLSKFSAFEWIFLHSASPRSKNIHSQAENLLRFAKNFPSLAGNKLGSAFLRLNPFFHP